MGLVRWHTPISQPVSPSIHQPVHRYSTLIPDNCRLTYANQSVSHINSPIGPSILNTHTRQLSVDIRQSVSQSVHQFTNQSINTQYSYQTTVDWHTPISQPASPSIHQLVHQYSTLIPDNCRLTHANQSTSQSINPPASPSILNTQSPPMVMHQTTNHWWVLSAGTR